MGALAWGDTIRMVDGRFGVWLWMWRRGVCMSQCACVRVCGPGTPGGKGWVAIRPASTRTVPRAGSQCPPPAATFRPTPGSCISDATTPGPGMMPRGQGGCRSPIYGPWLGHRLHCNHRQCLGSVIKLLPSIVEGSILFNQSPRHNSSKLFSTSGGIQKFEIANRPPRRVVPPLALSSSVASPPRGRRSMVARVWSCAANEENLGHPMPAGRCNTAHNFAPPAGNFRRRFEVRGRHTYSCATTTP